jgi:60 kDa SS-A/Ro ribonucleoprotein
MNLNTFLRHGVFSKPANVAMVSDRIKNVGLVKKAKVFPYQLMTAYNYTSRQTGMPQKVTLALQQALDLSLENIPAISGQVVLAPDMSGSMGGPVTGNRDSSATGTTARRGRASGATTVVSCREVAALVTAAFLRKMPETMILPFSDRINEGVRLNPLDSVATNARFLANLPSGGTDCSLPLAYLNQRNIKADLVIYVSDYESWMDTNGGQTHRYGWGARDVRRVTGMMAEWRKFKKRNPKARLVCVDLQPSPSAQVSVEKDILSIGGWSDTCFRLIADFASNGNTGDSWVQRIEAQPLFETGGPARSVAP